MSSSIELSDFSATTDEALLDLYEAAELARLSSDSVNEPFLPEQHDRVFGEDSGLGSDSFAKNPFQPFDDLPDERRNALTFRAVALGILCGALVNASNIYMGLKSGWTFSGTIFSSLVGFSVLRACSKHWSHSSILGGDFGPRENNIVQTTATATGGMAMIFSTAFPALYQLGLLRNPQEDFWRITALTAVGGFFGLFCSTPLRNFFIVQVAKELNLVFPTPSATAITIRSLHTKAEGATDARRKTKALSLSLIIAVTQRILSPFALGLIWDWHIFSWVYNWGFKSSFLLALESWGWFIEFTPAFVGTGMIAGLNTSITFLAGSICAWGIIGPTLVAKGKAFGFPVTKDPDWAGFVSYKSLASEFASADHPSPRYWLLWPGVLCMVAVSLTELACQWRIFVLSTKILWSTSKGLISGRKRTAFRSKTYADNTDESREKIPSPHDVPVSTPLWLSGLLITLVLTCVVMRVQYGMPMLEILLAIFLSFFFSFLAIQSTGATDITPIGAASKASQIVLGATTQGPKWSLQDSQVLNLLGGAISAIGAGQASELTCEFRIGYLLRTSPLQQWYACAIGTLLAVFLAPSVYLLFSYAYPCINSTDHAATCAFFVPSASAWRAVAVAVTVSSEDFPIPKSSVIFSIVLASVGSILVLVRHYFWRGKLEWVRKYHPNFMVLAMGFVIPDTQYGTAMCIGALVSWHWSRRNKRSWEMYGYAIAAGGMAGEGLGGVVNAVLMILGIGGGTGLTWGCPAGIC